MRERIARDRDEIAEATHCDGAYIAWPAECLRGGDRSGLDSLHGRHAPGDHRDELFGVRSMRVNPRIGGAYHLLARFRRAPECLALLAAAHSVLLPRFLGK